LDTVILTQSTQDLVAVIVGVDLSWVRNILPMLIA
jgi:hypothetical protein